MTTIAASELPARIEEVLARVRAGETVLVEDQGATLAQIAPCTREEAIERAFPGTKRATQHVRDIHIEPAVLRRPVDAVAMLIEDRGDRELLP